MEQRLSSTNGSGITGYPHVRDELLVNHRPKCKMQNFETPRSNIGQNLHDFGCSDEFLNTPPKAQYLKEITSWILIFYFLIKNLHRIFPLPFSPLYSLPLCNHHTVVHVHESF